MPTLEDAGSPTSPASTLDKRVRRWWSDAILLAFGTVLLRIPAYFASRHLLFDDGVYGASAVAMRHGALPFRDVFSSQGPLFLPLVFGADLLGLRTLDAPRLLAVLSGVAVVLAVYAAGRELAGRGGALLAAALVATSGAVLWTTGPLTSDGPGVALGAWTFVAALAYRRAPGAGRAAAVGGLAGAAFAVKSLLVVPPLAAAAVLLLATRRTRDVGTAALLAAVVVLAVSLPWGLGNVYEQSVRYHTDATRDRDAVANVRKMASTIGDRDLVLVASVATALGYAIVRPRRARRVRGPVSALDRLARGSAPVFLWLVLGIVVLATESPLWRNHVAHLVPPVALLVAIFRPPWRILVPVVAVAAAFQVGHLHDVLRPAPYRADAARVERALRALPPGARAISDDPGLVWRAGRRTPPDLVDTSILRLDATTPRLRLTGADVARAASEPSVCAVVVWAPSRFGSLRDLPHRLTAAGYHVGARYGDGRLLYVKRHCRGDQGGAAGPIRRTPAAAERARSPD